MNKYFVFLDKIAELGRFSGVAYRIWLQDEYELSDSECESILYDWQVMHSAE